MPSPKIFVCKICKNKFDLSVERYCPKCKSFNVKPLLNEGIVDYEAGNELKKKKAVSEITAKRKEQEIQATNIIKSKIHLTTHYSRLLYASWVLILISCITFTCQTFDWGLPAMFFLSPFILIAFLIPKSLFKIMEKIKNT